MIAAALAPYKLQLTIGAGAVAAILCFGAGWAVNGWRLGTDVANLRAERAQEQAAQAAAAASTLQADAAAIHQAATEYAGIQSTLAPKIAALTKELRNAPRLPVDCRPDDVRVRNLDAAIDAANQVAAAR
ncbi:hypothetical protein [Massilia phyllosphaerae]|uniref:hypothetical protein n=1 Tax=Massilia phyllosphaerae TaxID=3106034 RepID=UPI002B1CCB40|nr:hypothetical protein [Massilia sp. SGZ-792]